MPLPPDSPNHRMKIEYQYFYPDYFCPSRKLVLPQTFLWLSFVEYLAFNSQPISGSSGAMGSIAIVRAPLVRAAILQPEPCV